MMKLYLMILLNVLRRNKTKLWYFREERLEIPYKALRETLINSFCHRQWEKRNLTNSIAIYDDRVEIGNPGSFPPQITEENIKLPHDSYPYNMNIAETLYKSMLLENWGSGARRIMEVCQEQGVEEPTWRQEGGFIYITFKRPQQGIVQGPNKVELGLHTTSLINDISNIANDVVSNGTSNGTIGVDSEPFDVAKALQDIRNKILEGVKVPYPQSSKIIIALSQNWIDTQELSKKLGYSISHLKGKIIPRMISEGLLESFHKTSSRSPEQKYRATRKGIDLL